MRETQKHTVWKWACLVLAVSMAPAFGVESPGNAGRLQIWDNQPAAKWDVAYPVGNGRLGEPFSTLYFREERPMFELFDLEKDPCELNNLAGNPDYKQIEKDLKQRLAEWMIRDRDFLPLPNSK